MGSKHLTWALEQSYSSPLEKLLAIYLADAAGRIFSDDDEGGFAWVEGVSTAGLAAYCCTSQAEVLATIRDLVAKGLLVFDGGRLRLGHQWPVLDCGPGHPDVPERRKLIAQLLERDGPGCWYCGVLPDPYHLEHRSPLRFSKSNALANLCLACSDCNRRKKSKDVEGFRAWIAKREEARPSEIIFHGEWRAAA